ncbi:MAG: ferredoxin family protein [Bacteroidales bacterium]|jgi:ferredoxin|nr:ferredoxin family protein [Bacteroidota bacterium]MEE4259558.1 ferredoxin family protein [Bacteroidales bacterium]PLW95028.1 MAG: ferredoxin [Marinilabiliales bacterium]
MTRVVLEACKGNKHGDCVEVCPADCFYELDDMLVINPDDCTDCSACESECPEEAIVPDDEAPQEWIDFNANADFDNLKNITDKDEITR